MTKLVIRRCGRAPVKRRPTAKFGPIRRIQSPTPQCNCRPQGWRAAHRQAHREGRGGGRGSAARPGSSVLQGPTGSRSASCSLSPNSVLSMYVEGAYLLLGLDLQSFKVWGRSVENFLVSMLARQGLKSRQSRTLRSYVEQPCSRTSGTLRKAKAGSAGAAVLPAAVRRHLCGAAADTGRRTDATLQTDFPTSCRCSTCRCAHQR